MVARITTKGRDSWAPDQRHNALARGKTRLSEASRRYHPPRSVRAMSITEAALWAALVLVLGWGMIAFAFAATSLPATPRAVSQGERR